MTTATQLTWLRSRVTRQSSVAWDDVPSDTAYPASQPSAEPAGGVSPPAAPARAPVRCPPRLRPLRPGPPGLRVSGRRHRVNSDLTGALWETERQGLPRRAIRRSPGGADDGRPVHDLAQDHDIVAGHIDRVRRPGPWREALHVLPVDTVSRRRQPARGLTSLSLRVGLAHDADEAVPPIGSSRPHTGR